VRPDPAHNQGTVCPVCEQTGGRFLYTACDQTHDLPGEFPVFRCPRCRVLYLWPPPAAQELARYYPPDYYSYTPEVEDPSWLGRTIRRMLGPLETPAPPHAGARALDLGCGAGNYLTALRRLGWETWGVEPAPAAVAAARQAGHHVLAMQLEQATLPPQHFHLVTMSHVVEHLRSPIAALAQVAQAVAPGGRVLIRTPAADSLPARLLGPDWLPLDAPRRLLIFTARALRQACEQAGLRVTRITRRQDPRYLLSSLLRKWRTLREGVQPRQVYLSRPRYIVLGFPLAWLVEGLRTGDEITVHARKYP
jgi:2-polyprenyl-3-methyl-5-hydroxy-6-metoxy-1,4-benzoquinol methylase